MENEDAFAGGHPRGRTRNRPRNNERTNAVRTPKAEKATAPAILVAGAPSVRFQGGNPGFAMSTPPPSAHLLLFRNAGAETHAHLSPTERAILAKRWNDWYDGLAAAGKAAHGQPLALNGRVVIGAVPRVIDGPFAEGKEVIGGYIMLQGVSLDEATEIAKQCPGLPLGLSVEVRPVAAVSPVLDGVPGRPAR
jgi:hypothetical protein